MSNIRPFDPKLRDFMAGRQGFATGSMWGEVGRSFYDAERQREQDSRRIISDPRPPSTREPWFPFVDKWLRSVPMRVHVILGCVGACIGFMYGVAQTGVASDALFPYGVAGFIVGFVSLALAAFAFKLLLVALIAGGFLLVMYLFMTYMHH